MKITVHEDGQTITYPSFKSFFENHLAWGIEGRWIRFKEWAASRVCRFKGHVRHYDEFDVRGEYPFCDRCHRNLPPVDPYISPHLR